MKKRIILIGSNGQIGWELYRALQYLGDVFVFNRSLNLNFTDKKKLEKLINEKNPHVIVNTVAVTDVENAGEDILNTMFINSMLPGFLAEIANKNKALLIHFSTDSVFDGSLNKKYKEFDITNPLNHYSLSKLEGETEIQNKCHKYIIFRVTWIYSMRRKNFILSIMKKIDKNQDLRIVNDQWGSPSWARCIAETSTLVINHYTSFQFVLNKKVINKIYHMASPDFTNWFEFTKYFISGYKLKIYDTSSKVEAIKSDDFPSKVIRPKRSILDSSLLLSDLNLSLPSWKTQMDIFLDELSIYKTHTRTL